MNGLESGQQPTAASLHAFLETALPDRERIEIAGFREISAGWESDVYAFDLLSDADSGAEAGGRRREELVLRIYPGVDALEKSAREFSALRRLHAVGYPVPEPWLLIQTDSPFGKPFLIMERVPGRGMWRDTFSGPQERRRANFERFCRLFVELHRIDWRWLADEKSRDVSPDPYAFVDGCLALFRTYSDRFGQPGYRPILDWLAERRDSVPCHRPAGIHWDFHPENILLADDGTVKVIDWTGFEISDPRLDLAWTMILVGSLEGWEVRDRILETYVELDGHAVEAITFFEVLAATRRLASVTISLAAGPEQLGMRPGAAAMMLGQRAALVRIHTRLQSLTGLRVPEVEQALGWHKERL